MLQPIYCGYIDCLCLLPSLIEGFCFKCDLKDTKDLCPNGLGFCSKKECYACPEFLYTIFRDSDL